ncbi:Vegetative incompatibility protein HET-E-1, partial [Durusdinium trenchii]
LVHGLISAGQTIISTTVLILVSLFVFSCMAVELIAKDDKLNEITETKKIIDEMLGHFSGIGPSMVTLMQFVTVDSVAAIYFPIIINQNAMESAVQEAEEERSSLKCKVKEAIPELLKIFVKIDKDFQLHRGRSDESGIISRDEMASVHENVLPRRLMDSACVGSILDFFDFLDVDEKGECKSVRRMLFAEEITLQEDLPGHYLIVHNNAEVRADASLDSPVVAQLAAGEVVHVLEVLPIPEANRVLPEVHGAAEEYETVEDVQGMDERCMEEYHSMRGGCRCSHHWRWDFWFHGIVHVT